MWRLLITVSLFGCGSEGYISCMNEDGAVDWYILYKKPNSFEHIYIDSSGNKLGKDINSKDGVLAKTLEPILADGETETTPKCGFVAYNDQPPGKKSAKPKCGHSKGIVMTDTHNMVWLLHSTPRFPNTRTKGGFFPKTGTRNAQTFICATFSHDELKTIGTHLKHIRANIFDSANVEMFPVDFKKFWASDSDLNNLELYQDLKTLGKQEFKGFYKKISEEPEDGDLYVTIANALKTDMYAQTWGGQVCKSDSYCPEEEPGKYTAKVYNIQSIKSTSGEWNRGSDHSKWCVSEDGDWTCIADSNRGVTQFLRPGGALCIKNKHVGETFKDFIKDYEQCAGKSGEKRRGAPLPSPALRKIRH